MSEPTMGPEKAWYPLCRSSRLARRPLALQLRGRPVAAFRGRDGKARVLVDRCPHRGAPLSAGRVRGDLLECGYHGWTFDGAGRCLRIPGLTGEPDLERRRAEAHASVESDGLVFAWAAAGGVPEGRPVPAPHEGERGYTSLRYELPMEASLQAVLENILDVPHTAILHGGLFRSSARGHEITAVVRRGLDRVEAEYLGEPRPSGLLGRLAAPRGGLVTHVDRFVLPSVAQVDYALGEATRIVSTSWLLPEATDRTRLFALIRFRSRLPGPLLIPLLGPVAWLILHQDARMLSRITRNAERFDGERQASTELDLLGAECARLLREGAGPVSDESERRVRFRA